MRFRCYLPLWLLVVCGISPVRADVFDSMFLESEFSKNSPILLENTDGGENCRLTIASGGLVNISIGSDYVPPDGSGSSALVLKGGVEIYAAPDGTGKFFVENEVAGGLGLLSLGREGDGDGGPTHFNYLTLEGGEFYIGGDTAIGGNGTLHFTVGAAGGSVAGNIAIEGLASFSLRNDSAHPFRVSGLMDLDETGDIFIGDGGAITLRPRMKEDNTPGTAQVRIGAHSGNFFADNPYTVIFDPSELGNVADLEEFTLMEYPAGSGVGSKMRLILPPGAGDCADEVWQLAVGDSHCSVGRRQRTLLINGDEGLMVENNLEPADQTVLMVGPTANSSAPIYLEFADNQHIVADGTSIVIYTGNGPFFRDDGSDPATWVAGEGDDFSVGNSILMYLSESNIDGVAVENVAADGVAIGQGVRRRDIIERNASATRSSADDDFLFPNLTIRGKGTVRGRGASLKICAMDAETMGAYRCDADPRIAIGNVEIGDSDGGSAVAMDGSVELAFSSGPLGAVEATGGEFSMGDVTLQSGCAIDGHLLYDGQLIYIPDGDNTVQRRGDSYALGNVFCGGSVRGRPEDSYGICVRSGAVLVTGEETFSTTNSYAVGKATLSSGGTISANPDRSGDYAGLFCCHLGGRSGAAPVEIAGTIAGHREGGQDGGYLFGAVICDHLCGGGNRTVTLLPSANVSGDSAAIAFLGAGPAATNHLHIRSGATISSGGINVCGSNLRITVEGEPIFTGASAIAIGPSPYDFLSDGQGFSVKNSGREKSDPAAGEAPQLVLAENGKLSVEGKDVIVSSLQMGAGAELRCRQLQIFDGVQLNTGAITATEGIIFATADGSAGHSMEIGGAEQVLAAVPSIDGSQSERKICGGEIYDEIYIATSAAAPLLPGGIRGNWGEGEPPAAASAGGVRVQLAGAGGSIGTALSDSPGAISAVERLTINCADPQATWHLLGETRCGELRILNGRLRQSGRLIVFGNMLLLGCDLEWDNAVFNSGLYLGEDRIWLRPQSRSIFRNGFSANDFSESTPDVIADQFTPCAGGLRSECVLLGGDSQFAVDEKADQVAFQILGCEGESDFDFGHVAIRVVGHTTHIDDPLVEKAKKDGQVVGRYNVIQLDKALDLRYYDPDGNAYSGKAISLLGNRITDLHLGAGEEHSMAGTVSNVGRIFVHGGWELPGGFHRCGEILISANGTLDIGAVPLDGQKLTIDLDLARTDPYLLCGSIANGMLCEIYHPVPFPAAGAAGLTGATYPLIKVGDEWVEESIGNLHLAQSYLTLCASDNNGEDEPKGTIFVRFTGNGPDRPDRWDGIGGNGEANTLKRISLRGLPTGATIRTLLPAQGRLVRRQHDHMRKYLFSFAGGRDVSFSGRDTFAEYAPFPPDDLGWQLIRGSYASFLKEPRENATFSSISAEMYAMAVGAQKTYPTDLTLIIAANCARAFEKFHCLERAAEYNRAIDDFGLSACALLPVGHWRLAGAAIVGRERYRQRGTCGANIDLSSSLYASLNGHSYSLAALADGTFSLGKWKVGPAAQLNFDSIHQHIRGEKLAGDGLGESCNYQLLQGNLAVHGTVQGRNLHLSAAAGLCRDFPCGKLGKSLDDFRGYDFRYENPRAGKRNSTRGDISAIIPLSHAWKMEFGYQVYGHSNFRDNTLTMNGMHQF
jgi:hypothetical protein